MIPKGVRLQCEQCSWTCVMTAESDVPDGVRRVVEGVPYCVNCDIAMRPIASVETTDRPRTGISAAMTLEQIAAKVVEINHEAIELASDLKAIAEAHKDAKKAYDAKLVTLSLAVERLGRVMGGEQIQADLPLLTLAEQDAPASESAVLDESVLGAAVRLEAEEVRQELAAHWIVVDVETITAWTLAEYDAVVAYLAAVVQNFTAPEPECLPEGVPEHVLALHAALSEAEVAVTLAQVCGWSQAQRDAARAWVDAPERSERPDFIPTRKDEPEPARVVPRRRARGPVPVVTV